MSKEFSHHEPCPKCGSKDNLGVWTDGQKWCFGCGYLIKGEAALSIEQMRQKTSTQQQQEKGSDNADSRPLILPSDFSPLIDPRGVEWLVKYGITKGERIKNRIGWSDHYESLVFPVFDCHDNLLLYQRRYFGTDNWPKYHTKGRPEMVLHVLGDSDSRIGVLTEDYISAIKVGRQVAASPLWGSNLSKEKIQRYRHQFESIVIWLDRDKAKEAVKFKWRASPHFKYVGVVVSEKDPKEYNDDAIGTYLEPHLRAV